MQATTTAHASLCGLGAIDKISEYARLTDGVYEKLLNSNHPKLQSARAILQRIQRRQHWKCIGSGELPLTLEPSLRNAIKSNSLEVRKRIAAAFGQQGEGSLDPEDLVLKVVTFNYGFGTRNPLERVKFWQKKSPNVAFNIKKDQVGPQVSYPYLESSASDGTTVCK